MKTNKNGVKLLAAVAVLVMVFAAFAIVGADSDAAATSITSDAFKEKAVNKVITLDGDYVVTGNIDLTGYTVKTSEHSVTFKGNVTGGTIEGSTTQFINTVSEAAESFTWTGVTVNSTVTVGQVFGMAYGTLTLDGCTVNCSESIYAIYNWLGNLNIVNGTTITKGYIGFDATGTNVMKVDGSTVNEIDIINSNKNVNPTVTVDVGTDLIIQNEGVVSILNLGYPSFDGSWNENKGAVVINIPASKALSVPAITGTGTINNSNGGTLSCDSIASGVKVLGGASGVPEVGSSTGTASQNQSAINDAFVAVDTVKISAGPIGDYEVPAGKTLIIGSGVTTDGETDITIGTGSTVSIDDSRGKTFNLVGNGSTVKFTNFTGTFSATRGSVIVNGAEITGGSIDVTGTVSISGRISGEFTVNAVAANAEVKLGDLVVEDGAKLIFTKDVDASGSYKNGLVTVTGDFEVKGLVLDGTPASGITKITEDGNDGNILVYSTANYTIKLDGAEFGTTDPQFQFKGYMKNNVDVSDEQSLTGDLYIASGYTLTVRSGGVLNLNGYGIYVEGTLAVEANGAIVNVGPGTGTVYGNKIILWKDGVISNAGVIGSGSNVIVTAAIPDTSAAEVKITVPNGYTGVGQTTMKNVTGVGFSVAKNGNNYALNITGDVSSYGMYGENTIAISNVIIIDDFSVGENVVLTASVENVLKKGAVMKVYGTVRGGDYIFMNNGTIVEIYGSVDKVKAYVGDLRIDAATFTEYAQVALDKVTNVILSVGQNQHIVDNDTYVEQRLYISGTAAYLVNGGTGGSIIVTSDATGSHVYVADDAKVVLDKIDFTGNGKVIVLGQIQYDSTSTVSGFIGTLYNVIDSDMKRTYYVTTFEKAYANIDSAERKTVKVFGDLVFDSDITLNEGQKIEANSGTKFSVGEEATVILNKGGVISGAVQKVEGVLVIKTGASCATPTEYAVKKTGTDYVQYSGIVPALNGAQPGDVIDIKGATTVSNLKVPAQTTVNISEGVIVTIEKSLTVEEGAKLVNKGTINLTGEKSKVAVDGDLVSSDGNMAFTAVLAPGADDFRSFDISGKAVLGNDAYTSVGGKINGAMYVDESGKVITTPSKAAAAMATVDGSRAVEVIGKLSDSTAIVLPDNTTLTITGEAVLGTITLGKNATVDVNGILTAEVIGQNGVVETTGAVTDSVVKVSKITVITINSNSAMNSSGKTVWTTTVTPDSGTTAINGAIEIVSGAVQIADMKVDGQDKTLTVAADATLVVPADVTLDAGANGSSGSSVTVKGTIVVNGEVTVNGKMTVSGEMQIVKNNGDGEATVAVANDPAVGTLTITGSVSVSADETNSGVLSVAGILKVGTAITSTGAAASVAGPVTITAGYVMVYAGADVSAAKMNWDNMEDKSEAVSTKVVIGGLDYATLYAADGSSIAIVGNVITSNTVKIAGLDLSDIGECGTDKLWFTDSALTTKLSDTNNKIGKKTAIYYDAPAAEVSGKITAGTGLDIFIDGLSVNNFLEDGKYWLAVGEHAVTLGVHTGYDGSKAVITFNGTTVSNGKIVVTADMAEFVLTASGATPAVTPTPEPTPIQPTEKDDGMGLTEYLLIVLVILAAILVIVVAIRMMRS